MPNRLYVASQDDATRKWHTIAMLKKLNSGYEFIFTEGVTHLKSIPRDLFRMNINDRFTFDALIPIFRNRLPPRSRPDFLKMAHWLNLSGGESEFELLSRFGLIPGIDSLLLYPEPEILNGVYTLEFFIHGIRHMHKSAKDVCNEVYEGDRLFPVLDVQNPVDSAAVGLRSSDMVFLGYVPTFYARDFSKILADHRSCKDARISVVRNNKDAPDQLRLLCRFTARVDRDFKALEGDAQRPLLGEIMPSV